MAKHIQTKIRNYILRLIEENKTNVVDKAIETFGVSKSTVYNYINMLISENLIKKTEGGKIRYSLVSDTRLFMYENSSERKLSEDRIFNKDIKPLLNDLKDNVVRIWQHAFTEMMNNAIEHSNASRIVCMVSRDCLNTVVVIADNGIGIFKNIQEYIEKESGEELMLSECASLLLAGKFTTAKEGHSGEGIFFTSHMMDEFVIFSGDVVFSRDNFEDIQLKREFENESTLVYMKLSNQSTKTTLKIFNLFSTFEEGFYKTQIPVAHMFPGGGPVSRSEARRLGEIMTQFKEVELDFSGVVEVGQAFSHELFIVWKGRYPDIEIKRTNENSAVSNMILRVLNT